MQAETETLIVASASSGLHVNVHPLPILNISDHSTRVRFSKEAKPKLIGALLGSQANRQLSVVNSFELTYLDPDVSGRCPVDLEFFSTRKEQFKQVFPSLDVVGWYTVGPEPAPVDVALHKQFLSVIDSPILLLFSTAETSGLPIKVFEAVADETVDGFVQLDYGIETGEAERIAVDGISRGTSDESAIVSSLATQRNAILMLYERITVLLNYATAVILRQAAPDHSLIRQMSSVVASLPSMDAKAFQDELKVEYSDVHLTNYLTTLVKQLSTLSEYADKHSVIHPDSSGTSVEHSVGRQGRGFGYAGRSRK